MRKLRKKSASVLVPVVLGCSTLVSHSGAAEAPQVILQSGDSAPGISLSLVEGVTVVDVASHGSCLIRGEYASASDGVVAGDAYWLWDGGSIQLLTRENSLIFGDEHVETIYGGRLASADVFYFVAETRNIVTDEISVALYKEYAGGQLERVVGTGDTVPGIGQVTGAVYSRFGVNNHGDCVVELNEPKGDGSGGYTSYLLSIKNSQMPVAIAVEGENAPNGSDVFTSFSQYRINDQGVIAFVNLFNGLNGAVFTWHNGVLVEQMRTDDPIVNSAEAVGTIGQWLTINNRNQLAADGPLYLGGSMFSERLYVGGHASGVHILAAEDEVALIDEGATFEWFPLIGDNSSSDSAPYPVISDSGMISFVSDLGYVPESASQVIWLASSDGVIDDQAIAVRSGSHTPELPGVSFANFDVPFLPQHGFADLHQVPELNQAGEILFYAELGGNSVTEMNDGSVWHYVQGFEPMLVYREGDQIEMPDGTMKTIILKNNFRSVPTGTGGSEGQRRHMSDSGSAFLELDFDDGTEAIVAFDLSSIAGECRPDLNDDGALNFFDVSAFLTAYQSEDPIADMNGDGMIDFFDVSAFVVAFQDGCP